METPLRPAMPSPVKKEEDEDVLRCPPLTSVGSDPALGLSGGNLGDGHIHNYGYTHVPAHADFVPSRATSLPPLESSAGSSKYAGSHSADNTPMMSHAKFDTELWAANAITNAASGTNTGGSASGNDINTPSKHGSLSPNIGQANGSGAVDGLGNSNNVAGSSVHPANGAGQEGESSRVSAYARLDFESFTFYVQTLQVILGRRAENGTGMVDVHLGPTKAISRRHAKIFYNFGTQRFELSVLGRNGAFVGDVFVETGSTVPLKDGTKIQIGQIPFTFVLPGGGYQQQQQQQQQQQGMEGGLIAGENGTTSAGALGSNDDEAAGNMNSSDGTNLNRHLPMSTFEPVGFDPKGKDLKDKDREKDGKRVNNKKKEYTLDEIPPEFREKPNQSYSQLIAAAMRAHSPISGMTLGDIYKAIQELFPYYKYCPSGWQNSVRHNLSSNKAFKKVSKEGKGWLWGIDEEYYQEKERQRQRQQAKPKAMTPAGGPLGSVGGPGMGADKQRSKTIAELAREIEVNNNMHHDRLYNPGASGDGMWPNMTSAMPDDHHQQVYDIYTPGQDPSLSQTQQQQPRRQPFDTNNIQFEYQTQMQRSSSSLSHGSNNNHNSNANVPGMSTFRTKQPVMPVDHVAAAAAAAATTPSTSASAGKPSLPLSQETVKALAHLRKKVLTQMEAMGLPAPNVATLTNALAVALAQAAKTVPGGVTALLSGKNPTQLTQVLQVALKEVLKKGHQSDGSQPRPSPLPQSQSQLQSQPQPQSRSLPPPQPQDQISSQAQKVTPVGISSGQSLPQPGLVSEPSGTAPLSASSQSDIHDTKPTPVSTTDNNQTSSVPPPSTMGKTPSPAPNTTASANAAAASAAAATASLLTPGEKPNAAQIAQLLAQASKIPNPSPSMKAMLDKLRTHLAKAKRPLSPSSSGDSNGEPASKAARID